VVGHLAFSPPRAECFTNAAKANGKNKKVFVYRLEAGTSENLAVLIQQENSESIAPHGHDFKPSIIFLELFCVCRLQNII